LQSKKERLSSSTEREDTRLTSSLFRKRGDPLPEGKPFQEPAFGRRGRAAWAFQEKGRPPPLPRRGGGGGLLPLKSLTGKDPLTGGEEGTRPFLRLERQGKKGGCALPLEGGGEYSGKEKEGACLLAQNSERKSDQGGGGKKNLML